MTASLLGAGGAVSLAWLPFPMSSREDMAKGMRGVNDVGHLILTAVTLLLILAQIRSAAAVYGPRFRRYSLGTAASVLVFGALVGPGAQKLPEGLPTRMGLVERISIGAWLQWMAALAVNLMRRPGGRR